MTSTGRGGFPTLPEAGADQVDRAFLDLLTRAADARVPEVVKGCQDRITELAALGMARGCARALRLLASVYVWAPSAHHHDAALLGPMGELAGALESAQAEDGLYDQGAVHSPPDTAFSIVDLALLWPLLERDGHSPTRAVRDTVERVLRKAGPGLAGGGLHTPNHRWKLCAALARLDRLWPDPSYSERIDAWLAEGVDQYEGGQYSERSVTYASVVSNPSLLTLARLTGRPGLYRHVRASLEATLFTMEPNGEVETVQSRRQDQTQVRQVAEYWLQFRELAQRDGDGRFAAVAAWLQERGAGQEMGETPLGDRLADVLDAPDLAGPLPAVEPLPDGFRHHDRSVGLVRLRRGDRTATVYGGCDHAEGAVASGLATNPTFFKMRKGAAILDSLRMSPRFFSLGHFRAQTLEPVDGGWQLAAEVRAAFHLPLPEEHRRADGRYPLTDDGRFWSAMDFGHRPKQWRSLRTEVLVEEADGGFDVGFSVTGSEVPLAVELCFRPGGVLEGTRPVPGQDGVHQLVEGWGSYTVGEDRIDFGPGNGSGPGRPAVVDPGERYIWLSGGLTPPGVRVLVTGRSPLAYTLRLR